MFNLPTAINTKYCTAEHENSANSNAASIVVISVINILVSLLTVSVHTPLHAKLDTEKS